MTNYKSLCNMPTCKITNFLFIFPFFSSFFFKITCRIVFSYHIFSAYRLRQHFYIKTQEERLSGAPLALNRKNFHLCFFTFATIRQACKSGTNERSHHEQPEVAPSVPACSVGEKTLTERACRIYACVGERYADEVYEGECETDGETGKPAVVFFIGGTENDHQEDKCEESFHHESASTADGFVAFVGGIDAIVSLVFVAIVKGTDTGDLKLDPNEREKLENAFALYLGEKSVNVSPGYALLFTIACIYGSKIYTALQNRKQNELIEAQRKQIEELKQQNAALQSMLARENEETDEQ